MIIELILYNYKIHSTKKSRLCIVSEAFVFATSPFCFLANIVLYTCVFLTKGRLLY